MTTTSTSVKIHGGHNYEFGAIGNNVTPLDLLISKEELIREVEIENTYTPSQLGKWIVAPNSQLERWITTASSPATPSKLVNQLAQNVIEGAIKAHVNAGYKYREAVAKMQKGDPEKGEEPAQTPDELSATAYAAILRMQEIERWKTEQRKVRGAQRHHLREHTQKVDGKWQDAEVYELPPLVHHTGVGIKHKPAYYFLRLPDKRVVNLSKADGGYGKVLRESPDSAMQTIATRLGLRIKGGAATILQPLTGWDDIVPAYTTVWNSESWFVIVGWMKNPAVTPSRYTLGNDGNLTQMQGSPEDQLTVSQLDYQLFRGSSDLAVEDGAGVAVDYMNEDEELVCQGLMRDESDEDLEVDSYLLNVAAANMDRHIDLRNGSAVWLDEDFRDALAGIAYEVRIERAQLSKRIKFMRQCRARLWSRTQADDCGALEDEALTIRIKAISWTIDSLTKQRSGAFERFREARADLEHQTHLCRA